MLPKPAGRSIPYSEVSKMSEERYITIMSHRRKTVLNVSSILYVLMSGKNATIHVAGDRVYQTRMGLAQLEQALGEGFIKVHRGCLVSTMAIHDISDTINLNNGESLEFATRKRTAIIEQFNAAQRSVIRGFSSDGVPKSPEEYRAWYAGFDTMPFAFAEIEMVFDEERRAVDWIFRYGNPALARLEKVPLEALIGQSFRGIFRNVNNKWLSTYERAALYGETLETMDYSPEIDTYLKVICFPTFRGHCGVILFDINGIRLTRNSPDADRALAMYLFGKT